MYQILSDEEISRVIEQARHYGDPENRTKYVTLLTLLANYGPRITEALTVRWDQFDAERKTLTLPTLKRKKAVTRTIPLHENMVQALQDYRARVNGDPRIFPMPKHGRTVIWRAFQRMLVRAGIPRIKLHSLRHSSVSRWAEIDLVLARDLHGHANIATTNEYAHVRNAHAKMQRLQPIT